MFKFINQIEEWLTSDDDVKVSLENRIENFEEYSFEKDLFFYGDSYVREKLIRICIFSYFKRLEEYVKAYADEFSFSNYRNFNEFIIDSSEDTIIYLFEWLKEENLPVIKEFIKKANEENYSSTSLYNVIKYYDYLVKDSLENNNLEATLDFLVEFISNIMIKSKQLSNREVEYIARNQSFESLRTEIPDEMVSINNENVIIRATQVVINELPNYLKSADEQTFSIRGILH